MYLTEEHKTESTQSNWLDEVVKQEIENVRWTVTISWQEETQGFKAEIKIFLPKTGDVDGCYAQLKTIFQDCNEKLWKEPLKRQWGYGVSSGYRVKELAISGSLDYCQETSEEILNEAKETLRNVVSSNLTKHTKDCSYSGTF